MGLKTKKEMVEMEDRKIQHIINRTPQGQRVGEINMGEEQKEEEKKEK